MRTLKIFAILCIIAGFTSNNVNGQPVRREYSVRMGVFIPCLNESLSGVVVTQQTVWDNKVQLKLDDGILIGTISRLEYSVTQLINHEMWYDQSAVNDTFTRTLMVRLDGKLVAKIHMTMHYTINANGEETVDFLKNDVDCK